MKDDTKNKIIISLLMLVSIFAFLFITQGFSGTLINGWTGIVDPIAKFITKIINNTQYGFHAFRELIWLLTLIPILVLTKNISKLKEKGTPLLHGIKLTWVCFAFAFALFISGILNVGIKNISIKEVIALLLYTILIGIFEELLCRGWILNEFLKRFNKNRKDVLFSIIMSSVVFGGIHIINYFGGQDFYQTIAQIFNAISMGVILGSLYYRTRNIWSCILLHAFWDFCLLMSTINDLNTCVSESIRFSGVGIFLLISTLCMTLIPQVFNTILLLNKSSIDKDTKSKIKIKMTEEEKIDSKKDYKIFTIASIIFILFYATVSISSGLSSKTQNCPTFKSSDIKGYVEEKLDKKNYVFNVSNTKFEDYIENCSEEATPKEDYKCPESLVTNILDYKLINNIVVVEDSFNKIYRQLSYKNVDNIFVVEDGGYSLLYVATKDRDSQNVLYVSKVNNYYDNQSSSDYLDYVVKSFVQVKMPEYKELGTIKIDGKTYIYIVGLNDKKYYIDYDNNVYNYKKNNGY